MKIRLACSLPAFETQELAAAVEAWCELLYGSVRLERLNDCYVYAMTHRTSTFPLAVTELIEAWRIISADEAAKIPSECPVCKGRRTELIYDPVTDTEFEKECPFCFGRISVALSEVKQ